jgi:hypothetical protein
VYSAFADDPVKVLRLPGIDLPFVLTDSTQLDNGLLGAGGTVRSADILSVHAELASGDSPVCWLLHHHLVPTPVTDLERSGSGRYTDGFAAWASHAGLRIARSLISNVDREELTMTAMGAGTVLSCLHTLGRPVLLLHGHKHYPTARLLKGIHEGDNDVALLSAGSAGVTELPDARMMSVWPSLNAIRIDRRPSGAYAVEAGMVAFPPAELEDEREIRRTPLVRLESRGQGWEVREEAHPPHPPEWTRNEVAYRLEDDADFVDADVYRRVEVVRGSRSEQEGKWCEPIDGLSGATLMLGKSSLGLPTNHPFDLDGTRGEARYTIKRAVASNAEAAARFYDESTPYEWLGLGNRYPCETAVIEVEHATPKRLESAFASLTNVATGREIPIPLRRSEKGVRATVSPCPARHLLRIYWRLPRAAER